MKRIANNLVKGKKQPSNEELIKLYESDGITPDFLKEQCVISNIPPNFYAELAVLHNEQALQKALKPITGIDSVEPTKLLFYEGPSSYSKISLFVIMHTTSRFPEACF